MTDVRLNPDFHDKTAEQMLYDLSVTDHYVVVEGSQYSWSVTIGDDTKVARSLYEAVLYHHRMYFPFGDDI